MNTRHRPPRPPAAARPGRGGDRPPRPGRRDAPPAARPAQWAAWAFLAPVVVYLAALLRLPALPQPRPEPARLHGPLVRAGRRAVHRAGQLPHGLRRPDLRARRCCTPWSSPSVSLVFQFAIGLALAVFFHQHFRLSATLRALFLVPWLLPLIVSASTWSWMLNSDSGVVNAALQAVGHRPGQLAHLAALVAGLGDHREHLDRHPVQPRRPLQRPAGHPRRPLRGRRPRRRERLAAVLAHHLPAAAPGLGDHPAARPGLHAQGLRHHLDHDQGRPGDSSTTFATWSYRLGFGNLLPDFGPGAAVGNLLIVIALVFGLIYIRVQRRQELS